MKRQAMALYFFAVFLTTSMAPAGERPAVKPTPTDKCPVCGMFVAKYPDFAAQIIFKDGSYAFFDGAKDMFKYYFDLTKYNRSKTVADIDSIYVTDYYDLKWIDAYKAFYVQGSDVYGPMGREIIPFEKKEGAEQ
ncbi:MAG: nitrous oxide reductase accessory protein NosL, partial [Phycisphaerae bacterium]|nr:nitrous oxide reductase accessory protein NosL [Phycisphaerae bacterium]